MAKRIKKSEEPKVEVPIIEEPVLVEEPKITPVEPVIEEVKAIEPEKVLEVLVAPKPLVVDNDLSLEQKITQFVDSRDTPEVKLNDFIKSTFGVPKFNEPPVSLTQGASKMIKATLEGMVSRGEINIVNNYHTKLGAAFYPTNDGKTAYHNLNSVTLVAKK